MSKVTFEFDGIEDRYDIALCTHRHQMALAIDEIKDYIRELNKYEEREQIPTDEIISKLESKIECWYSILYLAE